ncbi:MAG: DNA translocase FtsK, partial [Sulfuricurvum sp.]
VKNGAGEENEKPLDELYQEAKNIIISEQKTSISYLQRRLQIGYNRSATIIEQLEQNGILSAPNAKGNRELVGG